MVGKGRRDAREWGRQVHATGTNDANVRVERLCRDCAAATATDGGSVALLSLQGERVLLSSTDEVAGALEGAQLSLGEGPALDATTALAPVMVPDLADAESDSSNRWPFFAREAQALGVRGVFAFPIRASSVSMGTLGLYRRRPGALSTPQLGRALTAVEDIAAVLLELGESLGATPEEAPGTDRRITVAGSALFHQAAGMVMIQLEVSIIEAMALLRATAFTEGVALPELARDVVARRRTLDGGREQ